MLGSGAKSDHPELAAEPKDVPPGQVQVLLRLAPPEDVAAAASAFCDVGRTAEVRVNDRGPFVNNRVIDLSYAAADMLGVVGPGTARVYLQTIPGERIQYVGPFYVQYGAFVVQENARRLRDKLVARGFPGTRITMGELGGTTYWRVQIGAFSSLPEAEANRLRLSKESPDCFVIAD